MRRKHTPGPWGVEHGQEIDIVSRSAHMSATVAVIAARANSLTAQADARLIAAAPDLLACLRRMCGMYGAYSRRLAPLLAEDDGTIWTFERANELALEAIAKAEKQSASETAPTAAQLACGYCLYGPPAICTCGTCPE